MRHRPAAAVLLLCHVPLLAGCLVFSTRTEVVRRGEPRRAVTFESDAAMSEFQREVARRGGFGEATNAVENRTVDQRYTFVPFVLFGDKQQVTSESGYYNDQVAAADTNGDGKIDAAELKAWFATP